MISFGSDNHSGVHPKVLKAIEQANSAHALAYGDDDYTLRAQEAFNYLFGREVSTFFMFNGTGCNVTILKALTQSFNSIICAESAHINVDECGAPERHTGCKVISIPTPDGKLTPELIRPQLTGFGFCHHSQPKVITISQTTELGTLYSPVEVRALADLAHDYGMYLHVDGARIANAVVASGVSLRELTIDAGVDAISFGGTKNGMMMGEAAIFFDKSLAANFLYERKQSMQLYSKMRFVASQYCAYLNGGLWLELASHANEMAAYFEQRLRAFPHITITQPRTANALFVIFPTALRDALRDDYFFYDWNEQSGEVRLMCSFDTTKEQIDDFISKIE